MSLIDNKEEQNSGMIQVRRANVILDIPVDQKDYYKGLGYNVLGNDGQVVEETVPTDLATLQRFYKDAKAEIAELKEEIKSLKAQKKAKPVVSEPKFEEEAVQPAPKSRRRTKA